MNSLLLMGDINKTEYGGYNLVQLGLRDGLAPDRLPVNLATGSAFTGGAACAALSPNGRWLAVVNKC